MIHGYLLDTNTIAYWQNPDCPEHTSILNHINKLHPDAPLTTSVIVHGEIAYGHQLVSPKQQGLSKQVLTFVKKRFPRPLEVRHSTSFVYGKLRAALFKKYAPQKGRKGLRPEQLIDPVTSKSLGIQENDLWIASQAIEYNLILVTSDKMKHICSVAEELRVENWAI